MSEPREPRKPEETRGGQIVLGVVATALLHTAAAFAFGGLGLVAGLFGIRDMEVLGIFPLLFIGASQFVYVLPAWLIARRRGLHGIALGLVIGASLTFLANSACFGLLIFGSAW